jgi:hypothetical protein
MIAVIRRTGFSRAFGLALAVVVLLGLPTVARAAREPTEHERARIADVVGTRSKCLDITVSKVVSVRVRGRMRRYRYARVSLPGTVPGCRAVDGVAVFKRRVNTSRWRFVTAGSTFSCPVPHVPVKAAADLKIHCG